MPTDRLKSKMGMAFVTLMMAAQTATAISAQNGTRFQGRMMNMTSAEAENHPRRGIQRDATTEETPRRSDQSQGDAKGEYSGPRSNNKATLAKTKTTGEPDRTLLGKI